VKGWATRWIIIMRPETNLHQRPDTFSRTVSRQPILLAVRRRTIHVSPTDASTVRPPV